MAVQPSAPVARPRKRFWVRFVTVVASLAGIAAILIVIGGLYLHTSANKVVEAAIAEADRLDPGWRIEEIEAKRADVPDDVNGALKVIAVVDDLPENWTDRGPPRPSGMPQGAAKPVEGEALHDSLPMDEPNVLLPRDLARLVDAETERVNSGIVLARELANCPVGKGTQASCGPPSTSRFFLPTSRTRGTSPGSWISTRSSNPRMEGPTLRSSRAWRFSTRPVRWVTNRS